MNSNLVNEKIVVITGASRGLGKELALSFAKRGAIVIANYKCDEINADITKRELLKYNPNCEVFKADITKSKEVEAMCRFVIKKFGKVDVLINNAGRNDDDYLHFLSEERWNRVIETNLSGTFLCCKYFSKNMILNKKGKIINIASLKGQLGSEGQSNYSASKAAIVALTKSFAKEIGKMNVSVNAVCPGYIKTDLNKNNSYKCQIAKEMSTLEINFCLDDFVNFVVFLASDFIKGISGQVFNIDSRIM